MEVLRIINEVPWKHSKHLGAFMPTHQLSNKMFEADDPNFQHNSRDFGIMTNAFACYRETSQEEMPKLYRKYVFNTSVKTIHEVKVSQGNFASINIKHKIKAF